MFKIIKKLKNFFLNKQLIYFLFFLFFSFSKTNYVLSNEKIYLDLLNVKFENKINYKKYQTSTQLLTKTDLEKEIQNWVKQNIILKGYSGDLIVQILDESVIDSFIEEHKNKFSFLPSDGIAYKINFKVKIVAENKKNNAKGEVLSIVKGDKIGSLKIYVANELKRQIDILSGENIKRANIFSRIFRSLNYLVWGDV